MVVGAEVPANMLGTMHDLINHIVAAKVCGTVNSSKFEPVLVVCHIWHSAGAYAFLHIRGNRSQAMQASAGWWFSGGCRTEEGTRSAIAMTHWPSCSHAGKSLTTSKYLHVLHTTITLSKSAACPLVAPQYCNSREKRPVSS
jgi:hypothetical protein